MLQKGSLVQLKTEHETQYHIDSVMVMHIIRHAPSRLVSRVTNSLGSISSMVMIPGPLGNYI